MHAELWLTLYYLVTQKSFIADKIEQRGISAIFDVNFAVYYHIIIKISKTAKKTINLQLPINDWIVGYK